MFFLHIELPKLSKQKNIRLPHAYNIIINPRSHIGENVTIYHNVTIGSKQFGSRVGVPVIQNNVIIYPGSIIVGDIKIGSGAIVGAGSVVINDIPENAIVSGNPAKIISYVSV